MMIFKDTYNDFDNESKIETEIDKATDEVTRRHNGENFPFTAQPWALELARSSANWEYIARTKQEESDEVAEQARLEGEQASDAEKLEHPVRNMPFSDRWNIRVP